jgi:phenylacetate-CoA ligase
MKDYELNLYHRLPPTLRSIVASTRGYYLAYWRYGSNIDEIMDIAQEKETWTHYQWNVWQQNRLSYVLERSANTVPYYKEYWAKRKRNGDRASYLYLENWPILNKEDLRKSPMKFLSEACNKNRMFRDSTSGTTGTPIFTYLSKSSLREWFGLFEERTRNWHGVSRKDRWAILGGQMIVPFSQKKPPYWVHNTGLNQLYLSTYHISPTTCEAYIKKLHDFKPSHLIVYPSSATVLASTIIDQELTPPPIKVIFSNAEYLSSSQRALIGQAFNCPVINTYGMGEYLTGASECRKGSMHLWPEVGFVEVIYDTDDNPAKIQSGRFVITSLLNSDMPLIRYDSGDRGAIDNNQTCECKRLLPIVKKLDGRSSDMLITSDGRRVFWINPVLYGLPIREAQIIQEDLNNFRIRFVPAAGYLEKHGEMISNRLRQRVGEVNIILERVEFIPRSANGKFRAVISLIEDRNGDSKV